MFRSIISKMENVKLNLDQCSENLLKNLKILWSDNGFNDVTLAFDDESQFNVNRTLLAALSPHLKSILRKVQGHKPWLYMFGLESSLVKSLLDFVFFGEISIEKNKLESFVKMANKLQIDGFTYECQQKDYYEEIEDYIKDLKKGEFENESSLLDESYSSPTANTVNSINEESKIDKEVGIHCYLCQRSHFQTVEEHDSLFHTNYKKETSYSCNNCDKKFKKQLWLKQHERKEHGTTSETDVTCDVCYRKFKTISKMEKHKDYSHPAPGKLYKCNLCPKESLTKNASNVHYYQAHTAEERKGQMFYTR